MLGKQVHLLSILVDGMVSYTPATGLMYYNGTAWTAVSGATIPTSYGFTAGKNAIINGDFGVWQRGTSFTPATATNVYTADRFFTNITYSAGTATVAQQTFTPGTAPVSCYEGTYYPRITLASTTTEWDFTQNIEDVRKYAGQTVTASFWAKSSSAQPVKLYMQQIFGTGGSTAVVQDISVGNLSTAWQRFTTTFTLASVSGKTIGTNSKLSLTIYNTTGLVNSSTIDIWGVQLESGSSATSFQTATGTVQGELAACQRYYLVFTNTTQTALGTATYYSATQVTGYFQFPVTMRVAPTGVVASGTNYYAIERNGATDYLDSITTRYTSTNATAWINSTEASGTAGQAGGIKIDNASGSIAMNAEL